MTMAEKWKNEAWMEGREEGRKEGIVLGINMIIALLKNGLSLEEVERKINEEITKE